jgi:multicomponent Na+:H+ antiporter subunit G
MKDWIVASLLVFGASFSFLAGIGILRLPDVFTRMQASTKASTLGLGCMLLALSIHFVDLSVTTRAVLVILFVFITAPVAAHMIGRVAYLMGDPLWEGNLVDELEGRYDRDEGVLHGCTDLQREAGKSSDPKGVDEPAGPS